ncbi:MAG: endolytic transglycosylase MltG [Patescibacteria group bacterium]|nr:endolytic transglycosylase MltG [Patescibacteria group bacterium]
MNKIFIKKIIVVPTLIIIGLFAMAALLYFIFISAPEKIGEYQQFTVQLNGASSVQVANALQAQGFIRSARVENIILNIRVLNKNIEPGGYELSKTMNAWEIAGVFLHKPDLAWVVIPEGLRKEEIADILAQKLAWNSAAKNEWITKDTVLPPEYFEGVYFPDTYLIPIKESPLQVARRFQARFNENFAPYLKEAARKNIKWTTILKLASIIQREAAGKNDMPLISGILWNRLLKNMKLDVDSTLQYARGNTGNGWWAPITVAVANALQAQGFIRSARVENIILNIRVLNKNIEPGGYELSKTMNAWEIAGVFLHKPDLAWVVIPEGLRKEEIADILAQKLAWNSAAKNEWITKDTVLPPEYFEGVYFPDTYLIPIKESPLQVARRFQARFNENFAPYLKEAARKNIKWTTILKLASIIQREAAGKNDMPLISGILWNRLLKNMKLDVDSTLQYARGNTGNGWWAPITVADKKINSPFNTYLYAGLPPDPISNPGLDAINAAINPQKTDCLFYIHDASKIIHCSANYSGQLDNIKKYLSQ